MTPWPSPLRRRQAGFTIVEMMIALVLLLVGLMIAADLLDESSRLFVETSGEALDTPAALTDARIRADVQGATSVTPLLSPIDGTLVAIHVSGGGQEIVYQKTSDSIYRTIVSLSGPPQPPVLLWRGVTSWSCEGGSKDDPAILSVTYTRRSTPRTPLPVLPVYRGPLQEEATEVLYLLPRGDGW